MTQTSPIDPTWTVALTARFAGDGASPTCLRPADACWGDQGSSRASQRVWKDAICGRVQSGSSVAHSSNVPIVMTPKTPVTAMAVWVTIIDDPRAYWARGISVPRLRTPHVATSGLPCRG